MVTPQKDVKVKVAKKSYLVMSGKGGVGKSTVAVNLAVTLAKQGYLVGLLDCDLHGPSVSRMLKLEDHVAKGTENTIEPVEIMDGKLRIMSVQFLLEKSSDSVIWRGPLKHSVIKKFIVETIWGDLDYLIVDAPPGTGDEPLSIVQTLKDLTGAILITTPQAVATFDVAKSIDFCRKTDVTMTGIIENMAGFICPNCKEETNIWGKDGGKNLADKENIPFLGSLPIELSVCQSSENGKALITENPESIVANRLVEIAKKL